MLKTSIPKKELGKQNKRRAYSITWAASVVEKFEREHARATETILSVWDISGKDLALFLSFGEPFWNIFKYMVKYLERDLFWEVLPQDYARAVAKSVLSDLLSGCWESLTDFQRKRYVERLTQRLKEL